MSAAQHFGATPEEWLWGELVVGAAHLLPVVSNPHAKISPQSSLKTLGKTPSTFNAQGFVVGIPKWTQHMSTAAEVARWSENPDHGICIRTGDIVALDLDDDEQADAMAAVIVEQLGVLPTRFRPNSGRRIVAVRVSGAVLRKRSFKTASPSGLVEQLAGGQQFVACGTHPSGVRYEWAGGLPYDFPEVSVEALDACWKALEARFATEPTVAAGAASDRSRPDLKGINDPVVEYLEDHSLILGRADGKVFVECPWKHQHSSDSGHSQTAWLEAGGNGYERGHFNCQHTSHGQKSDVEFLDAIGYRTSGFKDLGDEATGVEPPRDQRFRPRSVGEILATARPAWFVKGVLPKAGLAVVYGESGSGKTFWGLDLVMHVALGRPWRGKAVKAGRVLYVPAEGQGGFRNRVEAYKLHHGPSDAQLEPFGIVTDVPNLLTMDDKEMSAQALDWGGVDIIVIDTLAQVTPGANENSSEDLGKAMEACRRIHEATGALVILVHHAGKDPTKGARGWSGLKGGADVEIEIVRSGDVRHARISKQKDGEDGARFGFELQFVELETDEDGEPISSMVVAQSDAVAADTPRLGKWQAAVLKAVELAVGLTGKPVPVEDVIGRVVEAEFYHPDPDPAKQQRDRRRDSAIKGLKDLLHRGVLHEANGLLSIPLSHKSP